MEEPSQWRVRGIRGATTVEHNTREAIVAATRELLEEMMRRNDVPAEEIASAWFTTTRDLDAEFPAVAAREMGWNNIALMCAHEMEVPGSLRRCLRILLQVNTRRNQAAVQHVYLHGARVLRPDVAAPEGPCDASGQEGEL